MYIFVLFYDDETVGNSDSYVNYKLQNTNYICWFIGVMFIGIN